MSTETIHIYIEKAIELVHQNVSIDLPFQIVLSKPKIKPYLKSTFTIIKANNGFKIKNVKKTITQEFTEQLEIQELYECLITQMSSEFDFMDLLTPELSYHIKQSKKGKISAYFGKTKLKSLSIQSHNKTKNYLVPSHLPFLHLLGITSNDGKVLAKFQKKYKQINKFIELIDHLIDESELKSVADMGSGKGYLTFALYYYLKEKYPSVTVKVTGFEIRSDLVENCNKIAEQCGYENLKFEQKNIQEVDIKSVDLLVALHACDIATDMAIQKGIKANAAYIVLSPCCHKQIRKEVTIKDPIISHGIYKERQCEMITDTIRSLLLESVGYKTSIFEFISNEHTAKNTMITAKRTSLENENALKVVDQLKNRYGIKTHYLESLLNT